jgi:hypothetical protein
MIHDLGNGRQLLKVDDWWNIQSSSPRFLVTWMHLPRLQHQKPPFPATVQTQEAKYVES